MAPPLPTTLADAIAERFNSRPPSGYIFIANLGGLEAPSPFQIDSDLAIRRATPAEANEVRQAIEFYHPNRNRNRYEAEITNRRPIQGGEELTLTTLPPDQWRYTVIEHSGGNMRAFALVEASYFTRLPLQFGFSAGNGAGAVSFGTHRGLEAVLGSPGYGADLHVLKPPELETLRAAFEKFVRYSHSPLDLSKQIGQFREMLELPYNSTLRLLGLFAILESVLTHDPKPTDPTDSITRQVVKKMNLLNGRFEAQLPYSEYFGSTGSEKVWKKLYGARSAIAHGAEPDFSGLGGADRATEFLRRAVSSVLRQSLEEPQLLFDLREC